MNSYFPKKKRSNLPVAVEENLQILVFGALALFALFMIGVVSMVTSEPEPVEVLQLADLAIVMGPVKTWEDGSTTRLKGVQLKIKNRGEVMAEQVVVTGKFRRVPLQLEGKSELMPGEIGDYTITFPIVVLTTDSMEFMAQCANCVPFQGSSPLS